MNLSTIRPGDIVRVDEGLVSLCTVLDNPGGGRLRVTYACGTNRTPRNVKAREVVGHWRKTKATQAREQARVAETEER